MFLFLLLALNLPIIFNVKGSKYFPAILVCMPSSKSRMKCACSPLFCATPSAPTGEILAYEGNNSPGSSERYTEIQNGQHGSFCPTPIYSALWCSFVSGLAIKLSRKRVLFVVSIDAYVLGHTYRRQSTLKTIT